MCSRGRQAAYREPVTLGLRINTDEREVMAAVQRAEKEVEATIEYIAANLNTHSYRKSRI